MSALLVSEVSRRRDYWRNTAVTPTKIQSSWRRIFVDRSYHTGPFLVGWSVIRPWIVDHALFVPQRYHRIDPRCPSRRDVAGQRRHGDQQRRNAEKCRGIVDANSIQHAGKEAC